ncbi:hypothetical protein C1646_751997 [Rhizophagus diaphanus]|nr:hypothetical protein C1646_751997 [Rhizophagus diaphanus] [Rhizophagus sp. MUCL 43196]
MNLRFNPSNLRLPKLHFWRYHVISAIRQFGAINGYTSETYETLHKFYVKNPYQKSIIKEVMNQILNRNHSEIFQQLEITNPLQLEGMENLHFSLNTFIDNIDVAIVMEEIEAVNYITDQGACFGKVLLLGNIIINNNSHNTIKFSFAMVKCYDVVPLDSITHSVHIIPRFHKENEFLMNRNIF